MFMVVFMNERGGKFVRHLCGTVQGYRYFFCSIVTFFIKHFINQYSTAKLAFNSHKSVFLPGPSKAALQDMLSNLGGEESVPPPSSTPPSRPRPVAAIDLTDEPGKFASSEVDFFLRQYSYYNMKKESDFYWQTDYLV